MKSVKLVAKVVDVAYASADVVVDAVPDVSQWLFWQGKESKSSKKGQRTENSVII